ncbi:MAG: hypothetical protein JKY27_01825 [Magnetovibrio sp.]|nr:hypothetical protein [Magnetovibrio sp.]
MAEISGFVLADIITPSFSTISTAAQGLRALGGGSTRLKPSTNSLDKSLTSSSFASHRVLIAREFVPALLAASVFIGDNIIGMLKSLAKTIELAGSALTWTDANVYVASGTRLSVGNLSADVKRTLGRLAELVAKAEVNNGNILSSTSRDLSLQTSAYGGKINITPQALDLAALGLENLNLHSPEGVKDAVRRFKTAVVTATQRVENLRILDRALNGTGSQASALNGLRASGLSELRGVLVNVLA